MEKSKRNLSIDILKFFAVLLITNSHFDEQYVYFKELATGGAIGDALFFFCSGYTLFLGRLGRFDTWYKRRIRRIYPSVIGLGLIVLTFYHVDFRLSKLLTDGAGWFVSCIMIYYVLLYFVRRYFIDRLRMVYGIVALIVLAWYALFFEPMHSLLLSHCPALKWLVFCQPMDKVWIYQWNYFKWGFFFLFMLMGAELGWQEKQAKVRKERSFLKTLVKLLACCVGFYLLPLCSLRYPMLQSLLILSLFPLAGVCMYLYQLCQTRSCLAMIHNRYMGWLVKAIGGLCLEIYLVQPFVRTTALNYLFPLNLVILFVAIVVVAYFCRAVGKWFRQTFSSEEGYDWKEIFKII